MENQLESQGSTQQKKPNTVDQSTKFYSDSNQNHLLLKDFMLFDENVQFLVQKLSLNRVVFIAEILLPPQRRAQFS